MSSAPESDTVERRLTQVVERLQIPNSTLQITQVRLNRLGTEPEIDDERMDEVAAAALAVSCREDGLPVSERDIAETWTEILDAADIGGSVSGEELQQQIDAVADYLDLGEPPAHPGDLIREFGSEVGMPDRLIEVAQRLLHASFEADATVVAGGTSPSGTAGATLYLAAEINDLDEEYTQAELGDVSDTSEVTVRNRYKELRDLLGPDRLEAARYQHDADEESGSEAAANGDSDDSASSGSDTAAATAQETASTATTQETTSTATTQETTSTADTSDSGSSSSTSGASNTTSSASDASSSSATATSSTDGGSTTASGGSSEASDVVAAVESEVDALTDELDVGASARLFARGMIGDAVDGAGTEDAPKLAGAALVAGARMEEGQLEPADIANIREFDTRAIANWLDHLENNVDVDIPRRSADEIVEQLVAQLDLGEQIREESLRALQQYNPDEIDTEYTNAELGAGAVFFAATVSRTQVDIDDLRSVTGATNDYITDAMNSVVVSLCLSLVRGDIDYEDCSWTTDLLESELSPDIGDSYTGRVIAIAKTYTAGREHQHIDDATLDVVLSAEE